MVNLQLTDLNKGSVFIGDKLNIKTLFKFEEDTDILWSGIRLITNPPCLKEVQVSKEEIFSKGSFEAGEYIREKSILIKTNVVPTIKNRDLNYYLKLGNKPSSHKYIKGIKKKLHIANTSVLSE